MLLVFNGVYNFKWDDKIVECNIVISITRRFLVQIFLNSNWFEDDLSKRFQIPIVHVTFISSKCDFVRFLKLERNQKITQTETNFSVYCLYQLNVVTNTRYDKKKARTFVKLNFRPTLNHFTDSHENDPLHSSRT